VVPYQDAGCEVASCVFSKAVWRYAIGSGVGGGEPEVCFSASRAQKWRIRRDQSLFRRKLKISKGAAYNIHGPLVVLE
jgi:hypothetical protein